MQRFLLVDDDERFMLLLRQKLDKYADCIATDNGKEAVALLKESLKEKNPFTAVFMDIQMPGMDGHQVVEEMRKVEEDAGVAELDRFKLIMISVHKDTKNVCKSFFHGFADAYVAKPDVKERIVPELRALKLID